MATDFGGRTIRFQKERFSVSNRRREDRQKLENQRRGGKALSLDPHKLPSEEEDDDEEEELEEEDDHHRSRTHQQGTIFHAHSHPYLQQQLHQQTLLYAGAVDRLNPSPPPLPPPTTARKRSYLPSSSSPHEPNPEHARLCARMGGDAPNTQSNPSRLGGLRHSAGEIVEVQGGHIVRSIGRKDRHSKVCTAKGPRDRRVRLSAHTAIQFYDVQDRLGYDRPSKAVDWLIKKAKASIDQLAELPAWHPTATAGNSNFERRKQGEEQPAMPPELVARDAAGGGGGESAFQQQLQMGGSHNPNSSFLPPSMDSDSIADTIKSFFPTGASTEPHSSNSVPFHNFSQPDLLSRAGTQTQSQDLRLSLQSFQDPIILHHQQQQPPPSQNADQNLFTGTQLGFDPTSSSTPWSEQQHSAEIGRFQRLIAWNAAGNTPWSGSSGGGFVFSPPPQAPPMLQPLFAQNQFISQRGPLQSSNTQSVRAWIDPSSFAADNHHHLHQSIPIHPSSFSTIGYSSGGGFTGFRIPARIQGDDEEHDGISDKPSSASSDSRH